MEECGMKNNIYKTILFNLKKAIIKNKKATLVVSGGSTPIELFKKLSQSKLPWDKITITLSDERCVKHTSKNSNENLVKKYLLQHYAKKANFIPFYQDNKSTNLSLLKLSQKLQLLSPFDIIILGMGEDGHTASLFPNNKQLTKAYNKKNKLLCINITPKNAPFNRISLCKKAIITSKNIYIHMIGEKKQNILSSIQKSEDIYTYPILAILKNTSAHKKIKVFTK